MMNYIIAAVAAASLLCAIITGNTALLSKGILNGASKAVEICLSLLGTMCLWNGIAEIAEKSGLSAKAEKLLSPVIRRIFPFYGRTPAASAITANITANLLGIGNAATPLGIEAMRRMKEYGKTESADSEMVRFVVMNTASLTLLPTTVAALRAGMGSKEPFSVIIPVWLTGLCSLAAGLIAEKLLSKRWKK